MPEFTVRINLDELTTMGDVIAGLKRATSLLEGLADAHELHDRSMQESWGCAVIHIDNVKPGLTGEMLIVDDDDLNGAGWRTDASGTV